MITLLIMNACVCKALGLDDMIQCVCNLFKQKEFANRGHYSGRACVQVLPTAEGRVAEASDDSHDQEIDTCLVMSGRRIQHDMVRCRNAVHEHTVSFCSRTADCTWINRACSITAGLRRSELDRA